MSNWAPHTFRARATAKGCDPEFIETLVTEGNSLRANNVPVVFTLRHLAEITAAPFRLLERTVKRTADPYRVFKLRKRRPSSNYRQIAIPDNHLASVQRWIHDEILSKGNLHPASTAFSSGCEPLKNAQLHSGAKWLVKMDITDFFEAVSERQVYRIFRSFGYRPLMAHQFSRLCTRLSDNQFKYRQRRWHTGIERIGHLPQGAPTSPMLANLVCADLDRDLFDLGSKFGCVYTRYADDIVFSTHEFSRESASQLITKASKVLGHMGFTRNRRKTHVCPPGARKVVTGLLVDQDAPRLTREFREQIKLHLYNVNKWGLADHCRRRGFRSLIGFRAHLHGLITYAEHIEANFGAKCRIDFDSIEWGDLSAIPLFPPTQ